jgi:hypothetical protein
MIAQFLVIDGAPLAQPLAQMINPAIDQAIRLQRLNQIQIEGLCRNQQSPIH